MTVTIEKLKPVDKPADVKILNITAISKRENQAVQAFIFGLGDDQKIYYYVRQLAGWVEAN